MSLKQEKGVGFISRYLLHDLKLGSEIDIEKLIKDVHTTLELVADENKDSYCLSKEFRY